MLKVSILAQTLFMIYWTKKLNKLACGTVHPNRQGFLPSRENYIRQKEEPSNSSRMVSTLCKMDVDKRGHNVLKYV